MGAREFLLVLGSGPSAHDASGRCRVTQKVSPRVMLVEATSGEPTGDLKAELEALPGVDAILTPGDSPGEEWIASLTRAEALFVQAFLRRSRPKERPGEGLDWDAEGFLPPDPPSNR